MPTEVATGVHQLDPALPADADPVSEGSLHLRLLKTVLKATFPNVSAPVTATPAQLNAAASVAARVTALEANRARTDVPTSFFAPVTVHDVFNCVAVQQQGVPLVPAGVITLWYGAVNAVPPGWALCNGANGTPDLRDRFVIGAGGTLGPYALVGQHGHSFPTSPAGAHSHTTSTEGSHSHSGATDGAGAHTHGGFTGNTSLEVSHLPSHIHGVGTVDLAGVNGGSLGSSGEPDAPRNYGVGMHGFVQTSATGDGVPHAHTIPNDGTHGHNFSTSAAGSHAHGVSGVDNHAHTVSFDNRPGSIALAYIMKL